MELLVSRGAVVDYNVLINAIYVSRITTIRFQGDVLRWILQHAVGFDINTRPGGRYPLLHDSIVRRRQQLVAWLLENGADISIRVRMQGVRRLVDALELAEEVGDEPILEKVKEAANAQSLKRWPNLTRRNTQQHIVWPHVELRGEKNIKRSTIIYNEEAASEASWGRTLWLEVGGSADVFTLTLGSLKDYHVGKVCILCPRLMIKVPGFAEHESDDEQDAVPTGDGNTVKYGGSLKDGIDTSFSEDLQAQIKKASGENCETLNEKPQPPTITITQKPSVTTVTGAAAPSITVYTKAEGDHQKGYIVISMPQELADRTNEIIARFRSGSGECDLEDPGRRARHVLARGPSVAGEALCAARAVAVNADPGGALADFGLMRAPHINFADESVARAFAAAVAWARARGDRVALPWPQVDNGAVLGHALRFVVALGKTLGRLNTIPASALKTDMPTAPMTTPAPTATTTSGACSLAPCTLGCSMAGVIQFCNTKCPKASCSTTASATERETVTEPVIPWTWPTGVPEIEVPRPEKSCEMDKVSGMPWNVFRDVPKKFCAEVDKNQGKALEWTVDSFGNQVKLGKRTPPPSPAAYDDYRITLKWEPRESGDFCMMSCAEV
ncbi:hypothetical protein CSOJ01_11989 [Colletotrichum sojae]|uniref:Ankyrin repeat protein n=1 Tax=Colletotrichum sojae TaxID=2175907 RepID=A0A8H6IW05_9PEZI|nr:hypothetical protein CSOJ01_11989 [Colletotrichum sojae]